jgi:hypothetical protein
MSVIGILITRPQRHRPGSRRLGGSWESCKVQAANQGDNATLLRLAEPMLNQATSTAQEFRGASRKPGIRVSQSDNQILTLLASSSACKSLECLSVDVDNRKGCINDF